MENPDNINYEIMRATEADTRIIQPIIDQIRSGDTKQALETIDALDTMLLDKVIVIGRRQCNSILKTAIEHDALEIINKLIEKNCNLAERRFDKPPSATLYDALDLWHTRIIYFINSNEFDSIPPATISIGKALLKKLFNENFYDLETLNAINKIWSATVDKPTILSSLLGERKFISFLFQPALNYPICKLELADAFDECLKILLQNEEKITEDRMFILELVILNAPREELDGFIQKINNHWKALSKRTIPAETKSLIESDIKNLLEPQTTSPMEGFPEAEYWRLFVDGRKQANSSESGWAGYEKREANCLQNMYNAFVYARNNLETEQLTYEITDEIHRIATGHLERASTKFRSEATTSGIGAFGALSYKGYLETIKAPYNEWYKIQHGGDRSEPTFLFANFAYGKYGNQEQIIAKVKEIIKDYHKNFDVAVKANDRTKQFQCIIQLAADYARFHPYCDGNNRTAVCILNRELQKHGFPLAILSNPNELEGHSQAELFTKVCEGMANFLKVSEEREPYPGSKTTDEFIKENGAPPPIQLAEPTVKIRLR